MTQDGLVRHRRARNVPPIRSGTRQGGALRSPERLTGSSEIPVAEESDKNDNHERREKELAPWDNERRREHQ